MTYFLDMTPTGRMEEILTEGSIKSMNKSILTFLVTYSSEKGDATHPSTGTKNSLTLMLHSEGGEST